MEEMHLEASKKWSSTGKENEDSLHGYDKIFYNNNFQFFRLLTILFFDLSSNVNSQKIQIVW